MTRGTSAPWTGSSSGELILALDTSGREGSVALGIRPATPGPNRDSPAPTREGQGSWGVDLLSRRRLGVDEEHASLLIPRIGEMLTEVGAGPKDLAGIVVGAGPGSFTGVRVGAATAKGMARARNIPLWAFSSLAAAAAAEDREPSRPRYVVFDARGERVYLAGYRFGAGSVETLVQPRATTVSEALEESVPAGALVMGDGATRHGALFEKRGCTVLPPPSGLPTAEGLLRLLGLEQDAHPVRDPGHWEPDYLRRSGAERMWKTRRERRT